MKQFNLEEYLKNPSRKVVTRDGRKVTRILCTDARGKYPIVALIEIAGEERAYSFTKNGCWSKPGEESVNDLFFAEEKHEGWINIYKVGNDVYKGSLIWSTEEDAKEEGNKWDDYIATAKIEWRNRYENDRRTSKRSRSSMSV